MDFPFHIDDVFITFAIILVLGVILPELSHRWRMEPVPFYIIAGIIIGPFGVDLVETHETLSFIGELGLYFLVFLAGMEIYHSKVAKWTEPILIVVIFGAICFICGFLFGWLIGIGVLTALVIGLILLSSSVAEVIPLVNASRELKSRLWHTIIPAAVILDSVCLVGVALLARHSQDVYSVLLFGGSVILFFILGQLLIPRIGKWYFAREEKKSHEGDLQFIIATLVVIVGISQFIDLNGVVAAFFAGLLIGETLPHRKEINRIEGVGHGLLIPAFFIVLGMQTNIGLVWSSSSAFLLAGGLIAVLIISKISSGTLYAVLRKKEWKEGPVTGMLLWPQLGTALAAVIVAREAGLVGDTLFVSVIFMAIVTALVTPFILPMMWKEKVSAPNIKDHVVLIGSGDIGSYVLKKLLEGENDFVVIDNKIEKINEFRNQWIPTVFGDATEIKSLHRAGVETAALVIICIDDDYKTDKIALMIKEMNTECRIVARVHKDDYSDMLGEAVDVLIQPHQMIGSVIVDEISQLDQ